MRKSRLRTYTANFGQVNTSKRLTALGKGARREYQQGKVDRDKGFRSASCESIKPLPEA